jgi:hypothetical protein
VLVLDLAMVEPLRSVVVQPEQQEPVEQPPLQVATALLEQVEPQLSVVVTQALLEQVEQ